MVARDEKELDGIFELKRRGDTNGVDLELIDEKRLEELEPNARTFDKALYSPTTSVVNPEEVIGHISDTLKRKVNILFNEKFIKRNNTNTVSTNTHKIKFKHLINSAGLYADKIAHQFGIGQKYTLIPFKGLYMEYKDSNLIHKHIYPVPNLKIPSLVSILPLR